GCPLGESKMHTHESHIAVRYAETDAMGVVHHGSYVVWFEVGRTEWLQSLGYHYSDFEQSGFYLVVAEIGLRYLRPARYGDTVIVRTSATEIKSRAIRFQYDIYRAADQDLLVTGFTRHILTDHEGNIRKFPDYMWRLIN
ncbi:MAG: acyl-CoA thioesterase, partial [Ardenticatenaceae bacterium]